MPLFYVLAKNAIVTPYSSGYPWPYEVALCFDIVASPVGLAEGVAHGAVAVTLSAEEAMHEQWQDHFSNAQGEWLLPIIRRMGNTSTQMRLSQPTDVCINVSRIPMAIPETHWQNGFRDLPVH
jgi:hypothetical protein